MIYALVLSFALLESVQPAPSHQQYTDKYGYFKGQRLPQLPIGSDGCYCPPIIRPVCGSTGAIVYTYMNECVLRCTEGVDLLYDGPCCASSVCLPYAAPVCDSENMIYRNPCAFEEAQCFSHRILSRHLSMDSSSPACACVESCTEEWSPVCDSTGKTHPNACVFRNAQCFLKERNQEQIEIAHEGQCCADVCQSTDSGSFSLCDSVGRSHSDLCSYYRARCEQRHAPPPSSSSSSSITIAHFGPCSSLSSHLSNSYLNSLLISFAARDEPKY
ncbi:hypothetical protein PRIPAC_95476 [Pristionchus pacificus]|uniref:Uncharacterized protein n=1 Tax=Pristionchus pacificus TaxID=54126 RepID=A0A2A6B3E6_PRIPA|nr:hypothetical protein PRIPAC_95476 [Pristionchus pacificus]|eukprot:PDM60397.1 hypothetical protein PRIPAC_54222 [Pristionchus pacificus]